MSSDVCSSDLEQLAPEYDFAVALKLDEFNNANFEGLTAENFGGVDVAIDRKSVV